MSNYPVTIYWSPPPTGWRCPVCGVVNAPWVATCFGWHATPVTATVANQPAPATPEPVDPKEEM